MKSKESLLITITDLPVVGFSRIDQSSPFDCGILVSYTLAQYLVTILFGICCNIYIFNFPFSLFLKNLKLPFPILEEIK